MTQRLGSLMMAFVAIFALLLIVSEARAELKLVTSIPGYEEKEYLPKMYSGFVTTKNLPSKIFSVLVLADESPETKPFIVFQNGGPGSSSLQGYIIEAGPYLLEGDGVTVHVNPDRWNTFANVLFMELPGGVGYSSSSVEYWNDELFAQNFVEAIMEIRNQFPHLLTRKTPLWLTGESYAGAYLTRTMHYIVTRTDGLGLNIRGLFIGNGVTNRKIEATTAPLFMREHLLISDSTFSHALSDCEGDFGNESEKCQDSLDSLWTSVFMAGINPYNLYDTCVPVNLTALVSSSSEGSAQRSTKDLLSIVNRPLFQTFSSVLSNTNPIGPYGAQPLPEACVSIKQMEKYFNLPAVQRSLHVENVPQTWKIVNDDLSNKFVQTVDSTEYYMPILQKNVSIRHFSGDADLIVNTRGTLQSLERLAEKEKLSVTTKWQAWKDRNNRNGGFQMGWSAPHGEEVRLITVRGGSHMAARNRARQVVDLLKKFIAEKEK